MPKGEAKENIEILYHNGCWFCGRGVRCCGEWSYFFSDRTGGWLGYSGTILTGSYTRTCIFRVKSKLDVQVTKKVQGVEGKKGTKIIKCLMRICEKFMLFCRRQKLPSPPNREYKTIKETHAAITPSSLQLQEKNFCGKHCSIENSREQ